jgi:hypothetical protein
MTAGEVITAAAQLIQVIAPGETLSTDEMATGLACFNRMLANWNEAISKALAGSYASSIFTFTPLQTYLTIGDNVTASPGWQKAYAYNLAVDLSPIFGRALDQTVAATAGISKGAIVSLSTPVI